MTVGLCVYSCRQSVQMPVLEPQLPVFEPRLNCTEKVAQMPTLFQRLEVLEAEVLRLERERTVRQKQHAASILELKQQLSDEQV